MNPVNNNAPAGHKSAVEEVQEDLHPAFKLLVDNMNYIVAAIAALLLIVAAVSLYNWYSARNLAQAKNDLGTILSEKSGQEKITSLDAFLKEAPEALKPGILLELANEAMSEKQYSVAQGYWNSLVELGGEDITPVAIMGRARCLLLEGKAKEAVNQLVALKAHVSENFAMPVNRQLAETAEQAGDIETALAAYSELADKDQAGNKQYLEFKIRELQSKK